MIFALPIGSTRLRRKEVPIMDLMTIDGHE